MNRAYIWVSAFAFLLFVIPSNCMFPWTKKNKAQSQMRIVKDMSNELKEAAKSTPTAEDIALRMRDMDREVIEEIQEEMLKEEDLANHKPHVCDAPSFERDYASACPEGWVMESSGQCWGLEYEGPCESLQNLEEFSDLEKEEFEMNCCVNWPKSRNAGAKRVNTEALRGSIHEENGEIVPPRSS